MCFSIQVDFRKWKSFFVHCLTDKEIKIPSNIKNFSFVYSFLTVFFLLILKPQEEKRTKKEKAKEGNICPDVCWV